MITFDFCGTSHGEGYFGTIKGVPAGTIVSLDYINEVLAIRKKGIGRSGRQVFVDKVYFVGHEKEEHQFYADGGDLTFVIPNSCVETRPDITAVRSGHVDLVGPRRYPGKTARDVAEIASARNSVCYIVLGAICGEILHDWDIYTSYYVQQIGTVVAKGRVPKWHRLCHSVNTEYFPCLNEQSAKDMVQEILQAKERGDSLGGVVCVTALAPMGIGEVFPYDKRLDAQIAAHLMGIPSVKGVSFGIGEEYASLTGVQAHDELWNGVKDTVAYRTNKCGGIVGGITTGEDIVVNLTVKPVPTVKGVKTKDTQTLQEVDQHYERADTCVVPTVGLIAKNILNYVLANQVLKQYEENPQAFPKKQRREIKPWSLEDLD